MRACVGRAAGERPPLLPRTRASLSAPHPPHPRTQGWRLDPLLLFGQLMTTGAALSFGVEALRLRGQVYEAQVGAGCVWGGG